MRIKRLIIGAALIGALGTAGVIGLRAYSAWQANGQIYTLDAVPARPVAIIFGAQVYRSGRLSAMLADRVTVGARLYHAGKVQALLLTGDKRLADL